jgi:hypothetical protein
MLPTFIFFLLSALGSILISLRASHEIPRILAGGSAIFCSLLGFALAPWPIQLLIFLLVLRLESWYPFRRVIPVKLTVPSQGQR